MQAKVIQSFPGRPDDEVMTKTFAEGEIVSGDLARVAVDNGWAEECGEAEDEGAETPLDRMTVAELKALAATRGIDIGKARTKAEIIAALSSSDGAED